MIVYQVPNDNQITRPFDLVLYILHDERRLGTQFGAQAIYLAIYFDFTDLAFDAIHSCSP